MLFVVLAAVFMLTDLFVKYGIENTEDGNFPREIPRTGGKVELRKVHNPGFPFGFLKDFPGLVKTVPLVITSGVLGVFSYLLPRKGHIAEKTGYALILGGAASNLFDRFYRGYVVDYIHVNKKPLDRAVFNLADFFITLGSAILAVMSLVHAIHDLIQKKR